MVVFGDLQSGQIVPLVGHADKMLFAFMSMNVINNVLLTRHIESKGTHATEKTLPADRGVGVGVRSSISHLCLGLIQECHSNSKPVSGDDPDSVPTLIIVRIGLGVSVNSVSDSIASLRTMSDSGSKSCLATVNITDNVKSLMAGSKETI
ncbi:hypothetical protein K435DRAFT_800619 [Dendrothele bispora CBS 962.96]|uniref:Uncharacterized protein n=1 Tax=Dendrothele bispora (strain CBS 962.96) TaxID=1314807 RepID=A0A4S8LS29_DENBC|nr:hypothetical protein K435DRAFT_800619 [Dendrothele bispora CBS 962.96]